MVYQLSIPVEFPCPPGMVFDALTDIGRYPDWTQDMTFVSTAERMHAGLVFTTETRVLGRLNRSEITVREIVPERLIVLESKTGLVSFLASYSISEADRGRSLVVCEVRLSFSSAVFNLARPVVQAVAEARIRDDLETLRTLLAGRTNT